MAQHSALTGSELHEPKGADSADIYTVYASDGAGSGNWRKAGTYFLLARIDDLSTADTIYIPVPIACNLIKATITIANAITSADAIISFTDKDSNSMGNVTITQSGSAAGDTVAFTPSGNNDLAAADWFTIETDGGSSTSCEVYIALEFGVTA